LPVKACDLARFASRMDKRDMAKSIEHYCNALGFAVTFQYGNPIFYTCLCRDEVALHLLSAQQTKRLPGNCAVCVFVKDVDSLLAELTARSKGSQATTKLRLWHARL
jgi:hypothetical protein